MKRIGNRKRFLTVMGFVLALTLAFAGGTVTGYLAQPALAAEHPTQFDVFWEAWDVVVNNFVDRDQIDFTKMTYGAIQGMLDSLGDQGHTVFFSPEVAQQEANALEGSFEGIGAYVGKEEDQIKIIAPIRGSPAEQAGVLAGDIILKVDGVAVTGLPESDVIAKVRGPAGSKVLLTVLHVDSDEPVEIAVTRARIDIKSVSWARIPDTNLAYIQITQFASDTSRELRTALEAINAEQGNGKRGEQPIQGIVLDLRNNPGGLLNEAIRVGSQFLPQGTVILNERDAAGKISTLRSLGRGLGRDLPMVALINEGSASAAEIVSGALQDNERAKLVGMTTVGTGTVLVPFELSDGSVIRLGVTNWLTPNQRLIKNQGIEPDITIEQAPDMAKVDAITLEEADQTKVLTTEDEQFNVALKALQSLVK